MHRSMTLKRLASTISGLCLLLTTVFLYTRTSQAQTDTASLQGTFPTVLVKSIDSKKARDGEAVVCQTAAPAHDSSGRLIPSGTKILGHVTQAQAKSKGDAQSSLAIVFDKVQLGSQEIPIKGTLQAVAPSTNSGPDVGAAYGPGLRGNPAPNLDTNPKGDAAHPILNSDSKGVMGFHGLEMGDNSVLTSNGKEVKLDSGTQILIHAE